MKYLLILLLLFCSTAWGAYLNGTSFEPDSTHKAIVCFTLDDWVTSAVADSFHAHGIRIGCYQGQIFVQGNSTRESAAQAAWLQGHSIGSHALTSLYMDSTAATDGDLDSIRVEFEDSKIWIDSLIQAVDANYDCNTFVYPNNKHTIEIDSLGLLTYDFMRGRYYSVYDDSSWYRYRDAWPTWRHLYRVAPYYAPSNHNGTYSWSTAAEVASDDTTNTRANVAAFLTMLKLHHAVAFLNIHPSGDSLAEMGQQQWSIVLDVFDNDTLTDVWVTTMDTLYAALGSQFCGSGSSARPERAYSVYTDCYYDSMMTTDSSAVGLGSASSPWRMNWGLIDEEAGEAGYKKYRRTHFHLGPGEFEYGETLETLIPCRWSGAGATSTALTFTSADSDYRGYRPKDHAGFGWLNHVIINDLSLAAEENNYSAVEQACTGLTIYDCIFPASGKRGVYLLGADRYSYIYRCIFRNSDDQGIYVDGSGQDSTYIFANAFEMNGMIYGIFLLTPENCYVFNNVFIPQVDNRYAIRVFSVDADTSSNRIRNNLVSAQVFTETLPYRIITTPVSVSDWIDYINNWDAANGIGTMAVDDYIATPYTVIASASDTVKWGGCQAEVLPSRPYGFSSYGLTQWPELPTIPGRFATIADSDSLNGILDWAWAVGDTISITTWPEWIPQTHDMIINNDVEAVSGDGDLWEGGWE